MMKETSLYPPHRNSAVGILTREGYPKAEAHRYYDWVFFLFQ